MSGVYISGMEMPKYIEPGLVIEFADGIDGKRYARLHHYRHGGLTEWLEAIPVPDHGRTIDADEFLKRAIGTKCFRGDYALMFEELVGESITIIPADLPVMYYPQVPGITPTVISDTEEDE